MDVLDDESERPARAELFDERRHGLLLAAIARGVVHRLVDDLQLAMLRQIEQIVEEAALRCRNEPFGLGPEGGAQPLNLSGARRERKQAGDDRTDRIAIPANPEIKHMADMAGVALGLGEPAELLYQPGLADAGVAAQMHHRPAPTGSAIGDHEAQPVEIGFAPDKRTGAAFADGEQGGGAPDADRFRDALDCDLAAILTCHRALDRLVHRVGDQRLAGPGRALQPRRQVYGVAGHGVFAMMRAAEAAGDDLAAGDAAMHRELDSDLEAKRNHRLVNRERRAYRALWIVAMGERRAEDRHHVVANMFVDRAAETLHDGIGDLEEAAEQAMRFFRIALAAQARVVGEVGEEDGDRASLPNRRARQSRYRPKYWLGGCDGAAAAATEFLVSTIDEAALGAGHRQRRAAFGAEAPTLAVLGVATWAAQLAPRPVPVDAAIVDHHRSLFKDGRGASALNPSSQAAWRLVARGAGTLAGRHPSERSPVVGFVQERHQVRSC